MTGAVSEVVVIANEDDVRRHVNPQYINSDGTISTAAFKGHDISLDLCRMRTLTESVASRNGWGMAEVFVQVVRSVSLDVVHKPLENDPHDGTNPAHCEIPGKATNSQAKKIRDASKVTHLP